MSDGNEIDDDIDPLRAAERSGRQAAEDGFDWPDASGPLVKTREELDELEALLAAGQTDDAVADELGDVLFSVVNLARHLDVDASAALRGAVDKFDRRYDRVRQLARTEGEGVDDCTLEQLERLWQRAKRQLDP